MSEWQDFCEKNLGYITGETDWIQTNEVDDLDEMTFSDWKEFYRNIENRLLFLSLKDALHFLNGNYIDPRLINRCVRRHNLYREYFILVSSDDDIPDEECSYYVYDEELQKIYIDFIYGQDNILHYINYPVSNKLKVINGALSVNKRSVTNVYIKAFKFIDFLNSKDRDYNEFRNKEIDLRKKEMMLFQERFKEKEKEVWQGWSSLLSRGINPYLPSDFWQKIKSDIRDELYSEFRGGLLMNSDIHPRIMPGFMLKGK